MTAAIELLKLEIAKCESIREVLQEGHPRIMRLNERIAELKESIHKLETQP